ncbi:ABC transporter substrate-binding protein [Limibaculum sp. FT325]|uniref:ABC transporter substrate-binding protein n=1 Tax=Thermohalobaculum sediminis TaxID=2939436 RepID=UPI0020C15D84|nr:ABC transporter substrate-binding protein [Limibaculum sediminis]MCL5777195.1 ABC transporter substrate-binding protein [Limibaculum sediminis]
MTRILTSLTRRSILAAGIAAGLAWLPGGGALAADPIRIGLVAALSGQSAKSGEAITRGLSIAIDEINAAGGVLGRPLELVSRDDESNPGKGLLAARELVQRQGVVALIGGLDTPVSLAIVPFANDAKVPFIGPWAAGTPITRNGAAENYIFRVSAVDAYVGEALVEYAVDEYGAKKPGMILINNPWGESNEDALHHALETRGMATAGVEKFETNDVDVVPQLTRLKEAGADTLFMVANVAPSSQVVKSLDRMGWDVPIVSHWGPAGGRFTELAGPSGSRVHFIQTFVFTEDMSGRSAELMAKLKAKYPEIKTIADVTPATGIANAYDAMHLLAVAIGNAGSTDGPAIRQALYGIEEHEGLIKTYRKPFSPENQDALGPEDYVFSHFVEGKILPLGK